VRHLERIRARVTVGLGLGLALAACRTTPEPPVTVEDRTPKATAAPAPRSHDHPPVTHVLSEHDHLQIVNLDVGDFVESPADEAFDWSVHWKGETLLEAAPGAAPGHERYRVIKAGGTHLVVDGLPKCRKLDGGCGTSEREWTIFVVTH
jgi:hypothetical protein